MSKIANQIQDGVTDLSSIRHDLRSIIYGTLIYTSITIAINLKTNLFEPRLHQPINDLTYFEGNVNYLILFLGLIDDLNLSR